MLNFQEIASLVAYAKDSKIHPPSTDCYARLVDEEDEEMELVRTPEWETILQPFSPDTAFIVYQSKELDREWEYNVIFSSQTDCFHVVLEMNKIEEEGMITTHVARIRRHPNRDGYYYNQDPSNIGKVEQAYPNLEDMLLTCVETIPEYRFHLVTSEVDIVWHDDY